MRLDHAVHDHRHARQIELVEVTLGDAHVAAGIDALDVDLGQRLPEGARRVGQHQMLGLAVEGDDGNLGRAGLHDLEVLGGDCRVRLDKQQRLVGGDLGAHDLDDLRRQMPVGVERREAPRRQQPLETPVTGQKCPLVVLDDDLESQKSAHGMLQYNFCLVQMLDRQVERSPATAHAAGHGHALESCRSTVEPGCVRVDPRIGAPVLRPSGFAPGRYPRGRRAPRRLPLRPPSAGASGSAGSAGKQPASRYVFVFREHGLKVGFEPTTLRLEA